MSYQQQPYPYQPYQPQTPPPAPAPKKKDRAWPWILLAAVIGVIIIAVATNPDDGSTSTSSTEPAATGAPVTAPAEPAAPAGPATTMASGVYQVGVDVRPGRYKTPGPAADDPMGLCYWARLKDDSGTFESIISNGNIEGPGSVTINKGEFVELTGGCTWAKVG